jgi:hypothetical protein
LFRVGPAAISDLREVSSFKARGSLFNMDFHVDVAHNVDERSVQFIHQAGNKRI